MELIHTASRNIRNSKQQHSIEFSVTVLKRVVSFFFFFFHSFFLSYYFACCEPIRDQGTGAGGNLSKLDISLAAQFSDHESQVRLKMKTVQRP